MANGNGKCLCFSCKRQNAATYTSACPECADKLEAFALRLRQWIIKREIQIDKSPLVQPLQSAN
jgi:hypothetical protein